MDWTDYVYIIEAQCRINCLQKKEEQMAGVWVRDWKIQGTRREPYKVSQKEDGSFGCDCPAWINTKNSLNGKRDDCKHILRVKLQLITKGENFQIDGVIAAKKTKSVATPELIRSITFED